MPRKKTARRWERDILLVGGDNKVWAENNLQQALANFLNQAAPDLTALLARTDQTGGGAAHPGTR